MTLPPLVAEPDTPGSAPPVGVPDDASRLLELAAGLHAANGDVEAWVKAVVSCRDWFGCVDALDVGQNRPAGPEGAAALAERIARCASEGLGRCAQGEGDALKRCRCGALAPHLAESANALRRALWGSDFESGRACWILARDGRIIDANPSARRVTDDGDRLRVEDGRIVPACGIAAARLPDALTELESESLFAWPGRAGGEIALRLHAKGDTVLAVLVQDVADAGDTAGRLGRLLGFPPRQGELAAHLVTGLSLAASARAMGISRDTANEHLRALRKRTGAADRHTLVTLLRRTLTG